MSPLPEEEETIRLSALASPEDAWPLEELPADAELLTAARALEEE